MKDSNRWMVFGMWLGIIAELSDDPGLWIVAGLCFFLSLLDLIEDRRRGL